ncbi:MAG: hypothetical protein LQ344_004664 [Seirophora lacunosa]|nr:MAG: hypothetical protein LQ344_004664 [Seirophora lacunosa]
MAQTSTTWPQPSRVIRTLVELHPDERVYRGVDSDGGLSFRQKLREGHQGTKAVRAQGLVALGLTEACCDIGVGKVHCLHRRGKPQLTSSWVYYVPMLDAFPKDWKLPRDDAEDRATLTVINGFYRIPRLLYAHIAWTAQERQDWMAMKHEDRLAVLNARGGALGQRDLVMPISFEYDPIEKQEAFRVTAYFGGLPGFRAFLAIVPKAYLS